MREYEEREEKRNSEGGESRSQRRAFSSREGSRYESLGTVWSEDRLSSKEVEKIRKWVEEKERTEERVYTRAVQ